MRILEIEGIGEVEVDDSFALLSPEEQADEVDEIVDVIRSGQVGAAAPQLGQSDPNFIGVPDAELGITAQATTGAAQAPRTAAPPATPASAPALTTADIASRAQEATVSPLDQLR